FCFQIHPKIAMTASRSRGLRLNLVGQRPCAARVPPRSLLLSRIKRSYDILPPMPRCIPILLAVASSLFAQSAPPEIKFDFSDPVQRPEGVNLGEAAGVAVNSKGHMFVFHRGKGAQLLEFDQNGKYLREIGKDLYGFSFAHVVRIDKDDNIWCVDEGSNM